MSDCQYLIFSDLDGSLLDHDSYSFEPALPALNFCKQQDIPVIFNTSKTATETEGLRAELDNNHPFIVENGSGCFIPKNYFGAGLSVSEDNCEEGKHYIAKCFGRTRQDILFFLESLRSVYGFNFEGFNDWGNAKISEKTGLSNKASSQANSRDYSEPLLWQDTEESFTLFKKLVLSENFNLLQGGRFLHLLGHANKGEAMSWLKPYYQKKLNTKKVKTIALGDGENDLDMLEVADIAIVIKSPVNPAPKLSGNNTVIYTDLPGPKGWNEAVLNLIS